jgi:hypothetical protein
MQFLQIYSVCFLIHAIEKYYIALPPFDSILRLHILAIQLVMFAFHPCGVGHAKRLLENSDAEFSK